MSLAVDKMDLEEVRCRLLDGLRNGRLSIEWKGFILGFAAAVKRGDSSPKQIYLAKKLAQEARHDYGPDPVVEFIGDGTEPVDLIDRSDDEAGREKAKNYEEF